LNAFKKKNINRLHTGAIAMMIFSFLGEDHSNMDGLAEFSLGHTDNIQFSKVADIDRGKLKSGLTKYRRIKKKDTFYLLTL
jgi:hypothetical protein